MAKKAAAASEKKADTKKAGDKKSKGAVDEGGEKQAKVRRVPIVSRCFLEIINFKGKGGLKAATAVNVRHILCEKHSKATEALEKIQV